MDKIYNLFKEERGEHFDPQLCDLFIEHFDDFVAIKESLDSGEFSSEDLLNNLSGADEEEEEEVTLCEASKTEKVQ